jgi:hypothetical protein
MAEELFVGKLDPMKVKAAIHQTKFWPEYRRDKVYGHSSTSGTARGTATSTSMASFSGVGSGESFYTPDNWLATPVPISTTQMKNSVSGEASSETTSEMESSSTSESETDIPIFFPVPFQELSSIQYYSLEEQLVELTAALQNQFQRHCFIKIQQQETQPLLVPFVEPVTTFAHSRKNLDRYIELQNQKQKALPSGEVDRLIEERETALQQMIVPTPAEEESPDDESEPVVEREKKLRRPIWDRTAGSKIWAVAESPTKPGAQRKRGPKPDVENHRRVQAVVNRFDDDWILDDNLLAICESLDAQKVPIPKTWSTRADGRSHTWSRAFQNYPGLVIKAIKDRLKAVENRESSSA